MLVPLPLCVLPIKPLKCWVRGCPGAQLFFQSSALDQVTQGLPSLSLKTPQGWKSCDIPSNVLSGAQLPSEGQFSSTVTSTGVLLESCSLPFCGCTFTLRSSNFVLCFVSLNLAFVRL